MTVYSASGQEPQKPLELDYHEREARAWEEQAFEVLKRAAVLKSEVQRLHDQADNMRKLAEQARSRSGKTQ